VNTIQLLQELYQYCKKLFIKGLLFLLPITITFSLLHFCFNLVTSWLIPLQNINIPLLSMIPHYEILIILIFIFGVGLFLQGFFLKFIIQLVEKFFSQIPLISTVYFGTKQLVSAFSGDNKSSFKDVVYIEFPRKGIYSIGFLTSEIQKEIAPNQDETYYNVYIPTTPNPTTGYFVVLTKDQFKHTNISRQDAITLIISGGILQPNQLKK